MKRTLILIAAAAVAAARAETPPSYTLAIPGAPVIRDTADASQNAWLASNCVASAHTYRDSTLSPSNPCST